MSAKTIHYFNGYALRPATPNDDLLAMRWTEADPYHRHMDPDFWLEQRPGRDSYLLCDRDGPLFFFKLHRADPGMLGVEGARAAGVETHIQFGPNETPAQRMRIRAGLTEGMKWLENQLSCAGVNALVFRSTNPGLIQLCVRRLGFVRDGDLLTRAIIRTTAA